MVKQPATTEYLETALRAFGQRQAVIANNIANINTPDFRRGAVDFQKRLAEAIASGRPIDPQRFAAEIIQPMTTPVDSSGNDVNLEMEIGEMIKNSGAYKTYLRLLGKLYRQMELAMQ